MSPNERKSNINLAARMPKFKSEAEEAAWWDKHENVAWEMMRDAWPEMFKKGPTEAINLRLPIAQLAAVRAYASRSGVGYQTLLKRFIDTGVQSLVGRRVIKHTVFKKVKGKSKPAKAKTKANAPG